MQPILTSIEDSDCYFDHTSNVLMGLPDATATMEYINRDPKFRFQDGFEESFGEQIEMLTDLRMTEVEYAAKRVLQPWLPVRYLQWKRDTFRFKKDYIKWSVVDGRLKLRVVGDKNEVPHYETPLLTIISRLRGTTMINHEQIKFDPQWKDWLKRGYDLMYGGKVRWVDFGARRRADYETEDYACELGKQYESVRGGPGCRGTSNVHFAIKYGLPVFGTYPHWYVMYNMALYGARRCNNMAMQHWSDEYRGQLGVHLTDTVTSNVFWRDVDPFFLKAFDGFRQDSGNPFTEGDNAILQYKKHKIDPEGVIGIFSDSLDYSRACLVASRFESRLLHTCGIGTSITHNVGTHLPPMQHVMKAINFNFGTRDVEVCKLGDGVGKETGTPECVAHTKWDIGIQ